ncbi:MAG: 7TM diverse intracellular signaling domain-containing protein [Cyclobacteriaceae bacterium]
MSITHFFQKGFIKSLLRVFLALIFVLHISADVFCTNITIDGREIQYYIDKTESYKAEEILQQYEDFPWQNFTEEVSFIETLDTDYWLLITIDLSSLENRTSHLEAIDSHIDYISCFMFAEDQNISFPVAGHKLPFGLRSIRHKNFIFDIPASLYNVDQIKVLLKIRSSKKSPMIFKLRSFSYNLYYSTTEYMLLGIFYGALLLLLLYSISLFVTVRETIYLYFILYLLSCFFLATYEDGLGFQYLWPDFPEFNPILERFSSLFYLLAFVWYANRFLSFHNINFKPKRVLIPLVGIYLIVFIVDEFFVPLRPLRAYIYLLPFLLIYLYTASQLKNGSKPVLYFFIGFTFLFTGIVIKSGLLSMDSVILVYSFNIGLFVQLVMFSMALARGFRDIKVEKEMAQLQLIEQLQQNEQVIRQKVIERTQEIERQKVIIENQNHALENANMKLRKHSLEIELLNQQLNSENEALHSDVEELQRSRIMLKDVDFDEFKKLFPDETSCMLFLADIKWDKTYACLRCGNSKYSPGQGDLSRRCTKCGYNESPTKGTIFHRTHFSILKGFYMLFLLYESKGKITTPHLSEVLEIRQNTCWKFARRVREKLSDRRLKRSTDHDSWVQLIKEPIISKV